MRIELLYTKQGVNDEKNLPRQLHCQGALQLLQFEKQPYITNMMKILLSVEKGWYEDEICQTEHTTKGPFVWRGIWMKEHGVNTQMVFSIWLLKKKKSEWCFSRKKKRKKKKILFDCNETYTQRSIRQESWKASASVSPERSEIEVCHAYKFYTSVWPQWVFDHLFKFRGLLGS